VRFKHALLAEMREELPSGNKLKKDIDIFWILRDSFEVDLNDYEFYNERV
jgi:hypothetical protein